jgi:glycosyltransferase involved in cell wall biosynthesis
LRVLSKEEKLNKQRISVAVQQHFLSHYRKCVFTVMSLQHKPYPKYTFFSGTSSSEGIKTIDPELLVSEPNAANHIRWKRLRNLWLGKTFLIQPGIVLVGFSKKYDCIIYLGSMYHITTWMSVLIARVRGKRVLMWTHGYLKEERSIKGFIRELFYRLADGLLLYGHRARDFLEKRGFDPSNLYVVYNSLDYKAQKEIRTKWDDHQLSELRHSQFKNSNCPVLIFIGRVTKRKGLELIFRAQLALQNRGIFVNVLVIGDGEDKANLEKFVSDSHLSEYVKFYGPCYKEELIAPLLMMSDICVSPGEVGLTCIHSMTYGTPVVTHDEPEFQGPEWEAIVPGKTGNFFKKGDSMSLALILEEWFVNGVSRKWVAQNCISVVERCYSPDNQLRIINMAVEGYPSESDLDLHRDKMSQRIVQ